MTWIDIDIKRLSMGRKARNRLIQELVLAEERVQAEQSTLRHRVRSWSKEQWVAYIKTLSNIERTGLLRQFHISLDNSNSLASSAIESYSRSGNRHYSIELVKKQSDHYRTLLSLASLIADERHEPLEKAYSDDVAMREKLLEIRRNSDADTKKRKLQNEFDRELRELGANQYIRNYEIGRAHV